MTVNYVGKEGTWWSHQLATLLITQRALACPTLYNSIPLISHSLGHNSSRTYMLLFKSEL